MPVIFLHIGAGKTGTSFLQAQLALQHQALLSSNIYYPTWERLLRRVKDGKVTSGNIEQLMPWLLPNHPSVISQGKTGDDWITQSIQWLKTTIRTAEGRDILLSGEALQHAKPEKISRFVRESQEHGYETRVIFYVRHALDHALSDYREHVQRGFRDGYNCKELRTVNGWLINRLVPFGRTVSNYSHVLPDSKINVRSYDADKQDLWSRFLGYLGTTPTKTMKGSMNVTINRSLTILETQFLVSAASVLNQGQMRAIGMKLISRPPFAVKGGLPKSFMISEATLEQFKERNRDAIDVINNRWLNSLSTPISVVPLDFKSAERVAHPQQLLELAFCLLCDQK